MSIHAVICDMDGVLFDTENLAADCWIKAAEIFGYHLPRQAIIDSAGIDAKGSEPIISAYLPKSFNYDITRQEKNRLMIEYINTLGMPVKYGALEFLQAVKQKKHPLAVATSTEETIAVLRLKSAGFYELFDKMVFGYDVERGKPAPDIFLLAAKKLSVKPQNCMVIEDSAAGLEAARAAGMITVHIPDMMQPTERMIQNSDYIFDNIRDATMLL